jgi:hypothetical protein
MNGKRQVSKKLVLAAAVGLVALVPMSAMAAQKLIVKDSTGTTNKFVITDNNSPDPIGLSAPDSGFVGIGTAAPVTALQIKGTSTNAAQLQIMQSLNGAGSNAGGGLVFGHNNGAGFPKSKDRLGYMNAGSLDDVDGVTPRFGGALQFNAAGDWSIDRTSVPGSLIYHFPSFLLFKTADYNTGNVVGSAGGSVTKMAVYPSGSIYIGPNFNINTPPTVSQKLEVDGGARLIPQTDANIPTCSASIRGTFWYNTTADTVSVCTNAGWKTVTLQ